MYFAVSDLANAESDCDLVASPHKLLCGEEGGETNALVYKRKFGLKIEMFHFYLLIIKQSDMLFI
jgi:hypothetical protein